MVAEPDLLKLWLAGDADARELTAAALAHIEVCNPSLNAVITPLGESARAEADAIVARAAPRRVLPGRD